MPKLAFTTDRQLRSAKPRGTDYRVGCGGQLYLRITPTGFKYWQVRFYQSNGKESLHQFASYPKTSLLEAKAQVAALLPALLAGRPAPAVVARQVARASLSFDDCAARFIEAKRHEWKNAKHAQQWKNTLSQHASGDSQALQAAMLKRHGAGASVQLQTEGQQAGGGVDPEHCWPGSASSHQVDETFMRIENYFEMTVDQAIASAHQAADQSSLPLTVFRKLGKNAWWHAHPLCRCMSASNCE